MNSLFKHTTGILSLFALLLISASCSGEQETVSDQEAVPVEVQTAEMASASAAQILPGRVESKDQANLSTIVMGTVTQVPINVGEEVEEGDVLVRIKDDQILAQKEQLEANMVQADRKSVV